MKMIKTTLALTGVLAAMAFAPEASAIPAFARQVGMACSACHYQHFPALNSFGRAFKQGGYTMVGAQEKIEGEGISLPVVMNAALVGQMGYQKNNGTKAGTAVSGNNDGTLQIPQAVSLFLGGRGGEHVGFEAEFQMAGAGTGSATSLLRLKVPFVFDVGSVKVGIVPFSTPLGAADSFEVLNTGAVAVHAFNQIDMKAVSAQQYLATNTPAAGVAFVASNDEFFANFARWGANTGAGASGGPTSSYLRAAWTTGLIPGFDSAIGFQNWSGTSATGPGVLNDTKAWAVDAQMMGDVSGMPLTLVASYARAPAPSAGGTVNLYNGGTDTKKSFNIAAELGVIPNKATVQLAVRRANTGAANDTATSANASDNAIMLGGTYNIALNARAELTFSKYSGDLYTSSYKAANGDTMTMLDLVFGF
jgi:hypothetical protein